VTRRGAISIAIVIIVALLALLVYSLDRTSWLLAQYELSQPGTLADWLGLSPLALGVAAALVIEVGAVALVAGDVLALERSKIQRYATAGLAVVLSVQALANLLAGYLRGYASVRTTLQAHGASADAAWYVAGLSWVLSSAAVPALIFILSKLAAHVLRLALSAGSSKSSNESSKITPAASANSVATFATPAQAPQDSPGTTAESDQYLFIDKDTGSRTAVLVAPVPSEPQAPPSNSLVGASDDQATRYECPWCRSELASKQAKGSAARYGCENVACPGRANRKHLQRVK
jgi:hypothetical protein